MKAGPLAEAMVVTAAPTRSKWTTSFVVLNVRKQGLAEAMVVTAAPTRSKWTTSFVVLNVHRNHKAY